MRRIGTCRISRGIKIRTDGKHSLSTGNRFRGLQARSNVPEGLSSTLINNLSRSREQLQDELSCGSTQCCRRGEVIVPSQPRHLITERASLDTAKHPQISLSHTCKSTFHAFTTHLFCFMSVVLSDLMIVSNQGLARVGGTAFPTCLVATVIEWLLKV